MKKIVILTSFLFINTIIYGQLNNNCVSINSQYNKNDTTHTFNIYAENLDSVRQILINYFGTPSKNSVGILQWTNKEITNLGKELEIHFNDKICTNNEMYISYKPFKSEKDKQRRIKELNPNQYRSILISFNSKDGNNIINSKTKAHEVAELLEEICACK
jgi:hypothetical protein